MIRRLLVAAAPFAVIVAVFAVALRHHLGEPERAVRAFQALLRGPAAAAGVTPVDFVAIARAPCAAGCAAYEVRVDAAGHVAFVGHANTCTTLPVPAGVDPAAARRLIGAAGESGVLAMPEPQRRVAPDGRSTILMLRLGTSWRRIAFAERADAPLPEAIARAVDELAGDARWLPQRGAQGQATCRNAPAG
jgi:hypothetical protein